MAHNPLTLFLGAGLAALGSVTLAAQDAAPPPVAGDVGADNVRQEVVYGDDKCSAPVGDEIVVCVVLDEGERYLIPEILRGDPNAPVNQAWATKIERIERISRFGTQSCSAAGLGGFTGCGIQEINDAYAAMRQANRFDWNAAIAAERQKRIDAIDDRARAAEAQAQQMEATRAQREAEMAAARERLEAEEAGKTVDAAPEGRELPPPPE